ncbi:hypothetical protein [Mucilaginibacter sp. CSA2-8R]|uniref:hypothetical protein n=1 Tax=Mucilaginibacter sp. CSA2-8R TaxID=3141542 RepID=UPI00315DBF21
MKILLVKIVMPYNNVLYVDFQYIAPTSVILPLAIGFCRYKILEIDHQFLTAVSCFSLSSSVVAKLAAHFFHNNVLVNDIYTLGEFPLLPDFTINNFLKKIKGFVLIKISTFIVFCVYLMFVFAGKVRFNDYSTAVEALLIIFLSAIIINDRRK